MLIPVHYVDVPACPVANIVQRPSLNACVVGVDPPSSGCREESSLKFPPSFLDVSPKVAAVVELDVAVAAGAVDAVA